jgi:hypothetical protein
MEEVIDLCTSEEEEVHFEEILITQILDYDEDEDSIPDRDDDERSAPETAILPPKVSFIGMTFDSY